jgi:hypothetical protein
MKLAIFLSAVIALPCLVGTASASVPLSDTQMDRVTGGCAASGCNFIGGLYENDITLPVVVFNANGVTGPFGVFNGIGNNVHPVGLPGGYFVLPSGSIQQWR